MYVVSPIFSIKIQATSLLTRYVQTCSATESVCGSTCCSADEICDSSSSTCSKYHKPKTSKLIFFEGELSSKAVGGLVTGVIAGVALIGAAVLWFFRGILGCFGLGKKKTDTAVGEEPPAYDAKPKEVEPQVHEVAPEHQATWLIWMEFEVFVTRYMLSDEIMNLTMT